MRRTIEPRPYIYGLGGLPVEQINNTTEKAQYLHHDQQGSTRLITGPTGAVEGSYTYTPYGAVEGHTGTATTALGYDGQYTSSDTGLIYLRARVYDPATAQFTSVDPAVEKTRAPYTYVEDNPLTKSDPGGECAAIARIAGAESTVDKCYKILKEINVTTKNLVKRLRQLKENVRKYGPDKVKNYIKTFEDKQKALSKSLKKWNEMNCTEETGETPPSLAWELLEIRIRIVIVPEP
jgi:RHS repeat-associated protein